MLPFTPSPSLPARLLFRVQQVRVRFLEVLSCNRHLFLELDVLGVLTEKCSGWGLRDSDTGAKVAALMEDARKVLNSDGGVAKGVAKSGLLDGFPPHFCFPSAAARPLVPTCGAAQRSSNVVTKTVAVSQKAAPLKPKPKEEHKPQPWESAIVQVGVVQESRLSVGNEVHFCWLRTALENSPRTSITSDVGLPTVASQPTTAGGHRQIFLCPAGVGLPTVASQPTTAGGYRQIFLCPAGVGLPTVASQPTTAGGYRQIFLCPTNRRRR